MFLIGKWNVILKLYDLFACKKWWMVKD